MATYNPSSVGVQPPAGGFQQGGWYNGRQYWGGTLSDAGVIHPQSNQQGAGQAVSAEVNAQSARQQGVTPQQFNDYLAQQNKQSGSMAGLSSNNYGFGGDSGGSGDPLGIPAGEPQTALDLVGLYDSLYKSAGISDLEGQYSGMEKEYIEAKGKINDNPFLSEATRVGRIAKIEQLFQERTANIKNDIATKKADIETRLNLETQQFDINSQVARDALDKFNTLLSLGALNGASGDDIAQLTRTTGLSSQAIYSAIDAKKKADRNIAIETFTNEDTGEVTAVTLDGDTGQVISSNVIANVGVGSSGGGGGTTKITSQDRNSATIVSLEALSNSYGHVTPEEWKALRAQFIQAGGTRKEFEENFGNYIDPYSKKHYGLL